MNKIILAFSTLCLLFLGCKHNNLVDTNLSLPENNWAYAKSVKAEVEVKDISPKYQVYFKFRHTNAYRYANLFVLFNLKGNGLNKKLRYQFQLAKADGTWTGKGSGDIFTQNFIVLKNFQFPKPGKYTIEIEQNMRDNPLIGVSDVGVSVSKTP